MSRLIAPWFTGDTALSTGECLNPVANRSLALSSHNVLLGLGFADVEDAGCDVALGGVAAADALFFSRHETFEQGLASELDTSHGHYLTG